MPHSSCDPCCDPTGNSRGVDQYRSSVVQILCASLAVLQDILAEVTQPVLELQSRSGKEPGEIIPALADKSIYVYAYAIAEYSQANDVEWSLDSNLGSTIYWNIVSTYNQALGGGPTDPLSELSVDPPNYLFKVNVGEALSLTANSENGRWNICYWYGD